MSLLSERLTSLREEKGWTKTLVANKLGLKNLGTYANWEYGTREPDAEMIKLISDLYDVTTDYLMGKSDNKFLSSSGFTPKEEKDMKKRMDALRKDLKNGDGLLYDGEPISEEAMESILEAMEFAEKQATRINRKYAPKNKKNNIE
ncbi:TPA: helix-turn-helix domain-containing protein [Listeria monocytogenes]|uniref:helix-turn-helix domain-containing protein n=1 Tax=Listeria monocytogenes TaxID=1639 RepID=UPI000BDF89BC|nr:helix-turn-helix transcriptional regulator [Listeria monocytogenes]EAE3064624.1 helix-turn-helix domain-containing protein [Listeria monocytogenes]ELU6315999.1 helix-turn-helix domain-containing protein [Listeria monocytogenes]MBV1135816.1 helix-turn-helix domain-containing protein [Listeria monocytogenes]MDJ1541396.1 helix-turn-helix domain-containing protein [Listeria monocytogenes]PCW38117.1 transcriptional regulator [Listeria monocytogenes]